MLFQENYKAVHEIRLLSAVAVPDENNIIESIGYNGFPKGCSDDEFPWEREGDTLNTNMHM